MNTIEFIKTLGDKSPANIRAALYKYGILATYESFKSESKKDKNSLNPNRMIFYTSKNQRFVNSTETPNLWVEANGLIIDTTSLKPVVIPTMSLMHNINARAVNTNLVNGLYDIYPANEGTTFNLYYWEPLGSWRISTSRSMDATDSNWGNTTYVDILEELLFTSGGTLESFYESLDKTKCYTFGFKHPSMHAFYEGSGKAIYRLWFIQSANCTTYEVSYKPDTAEQSAMFDKFNIACQKKVDFSDNMPHLAKLTKYTNAALNNFLTSNLVDYGYILRSRNPARTGVNSNILLESTLLQKIRHLYYHSSYNEIAKQMNYDREKYTIVHSYLDMNTHMLFIQLFPQYSMQYDQLGEITTQLVRSVMTYAEHKTDSDKTIVYIYDTLNKKYRLNPKDKNLAKIISSYILTTNFVDIYYNKFTWERETPTLKV